jgi:[acyl-carrier-protein] S-malonyltransferase
MIRALRTAWLSPGQDARLFSGHGSQFVAMARDLIAGFAPAAQVLDAASDLAGVDLKHILAQGPSALPTRIDDLQPVLTAISLGCCLLLEDAGYRPDCVAGHNLGEFAALYAARVLTLADTLRPFVERGRLVHAVSSNLHGSMLAVMDIEVEVVEATAAQIAKNNAVAVANDNAPVQVVISGDLAGLAQAAAVLSQQRARMVPLSVGGPWHSPLLMAASERFAKVVESIRFHNAEIPIDLNVSRKIETIETRIRAAIEQQLYSPARWMRAIRALYGEGARHFIEVGSGKILRGLLHVVPEVSSCEVVSVDGPNSLRFLPSPTSGTLGDVA